MLWYLILTFIVLTLFHVNSRTVAVQMISREIRLYDSKDRILGKEASLENILQFDWADILKEAQEAMPLLYQIVAEAISSKKRKRLV